MVGNLFVIDVFGLGNLLIKLKFKGFFGVFRTYWIIYKPFDVFLDFLCDGRRQNPGIGTGICYELLFVQFLNNG